MVSETEIQRQLADLEFLKVSLDNAEVKAQLVQPSETYPLPFLVGELPTAYKGPSTSFQLMYIPAGEVLEENAMLQIHLYTENQLGEQSEEAKNLLEQFNMQTLMGHFGISEDRQLFYRYVYALPRFTVPNEAAFLEVIGLSFSTFTSFATLIVEVAAGNLTAQEAIAALN